MFGAYITTDFTVEEGERIINVIFGDRASEVLQGRWQAIKYYILLPLPPSIVLATNPIQSKLALIPIPSLPSSLWKPIKGPLNDWPLGLCDTRSVDWDSDVVPSDVVFDDFVTENIQIYHDPDMRWYYLPDHESWEALIFKSADSVGSRTAGMFLSLSVLTAFTHSLVRPRVLLKASVSRDIVSESLLIDISATSRSLSPFGIL